MERPLEPDQSECCNSGCNPCIFDVFEKQLQKYEKQLQDGLPIEKNCLNELKYTPFRLINMIEDSQHANIYIFECNAHSTDAHLLCNVCFEPSQHLLLKGQSKVDGSDFSRAYTPFPWEGINQRQFAMLIKLYPHGDMCQSIRQLRIGDVTQWRGPYGDFHIDFSLKSMLLIAQGTGIAPLYAVITKVLDSEECETRLKLIYCCRDLHQTHLRDELYKLLAHWNFKYEVFLSSQPDGTSAAKYNEVVHARKLQEEDIQALISEADKEEWPSQALVCGSSLFAQSIEGSIKKFSSIPIHCF